jgi:CheY-like chemotaxis protein
MPEKRILLVEDDEDVGELLAMALEGDGYEVDVATTAAESWSRLAAQAYALVIADWRLPDGDGSVIADGAADLGAKTFIMSGYLPEMPIERREGHHCMMKPVRVRDLLRLIRDAIGAPHEA